uniref:Variant surface glycoprotein 1125.336 n=1 Tax=Trypanosoma brucei TaxID=5691 RepID=A0A1J0R5P2_9TRYP|nr:variant surface glycoprotein 1125.336 [Trypanosoma brucei]
MKNWAAVTIIALAVSVYRDAAASNPAEDAIATACDEAQYFGELTRTFEQDIRNAESAITALRHQAYAWQIAAQMEPTAEASAAMQALSAYAYLQAEKVYQANQPLAESLRKATTTLYQRMATVITASQLQGSATADLEQGSSNTNDVGSIYGGATTKCAIPIKLKPVAKQVCKKKIQDSDTLHLKTITARGKRKLKLLQDEYLQTQKTTLTLVAKSPDNLLTTYTPGHCSDNGTPLTGGSKGLGIKEAAVDVTKHETLDQNIFTAAEGATTCENAEKADEHTPVNRKATAIALCTANANKPALAPNPDTMAPTGLADDEDFQKIAATLLAPLGKTINLESTEDKRQLAELIKATYGTEAAQFKAKFVTAVNSRPVNFKLGSYTEDSTIGGIVKTPRAATALAYYFHQAQNKGSKSPNAPQADAAEKKGEKNGGDNKTNATDCTGAEEKDCDKEKCTWNAEKKQCKVKEGAAVISAVIKAPILLAAVFLS